MRKVVRFPKLHEGQQTVFDSDARFKVLDAGRRWRKSTLSVIWLLQPVVKGQGNACFVGPDYPRCRRGWRLIKAFCRQIPYASKPREVDRIVEFPRLKTFIQVLSASDPDALRSEGWKRTAIDEAAYCRNLYEDVWQASLRPSLADQQGDALFISTPSGKNNDFFQLYKESLEDGSKIWDGWQFPSWSNPFFPADELQYLRNEVKEGRMLESIFRQEYGAEFLEDDEMSIIPYQWIELAIEKGKQVQSGELEAPAEVTAIGGDPSGEGSDLSAICRKSGWYVHPFETKLKDDSMSMSGRMVSAANHDKRLSMSVDFVGIGNGTYHRLIELGFNCIKFIAGEKTSLEINGERFFNLRSWMWFAIREALNPENEDSLALPDDAQLRKELTMPRWQRRSDGKLWVESKEEIRKRLKASPDRADALGAAIYAEKQGDRQWIGSLAV